MPIWVMLIWLYVLIQYLSFVLLSCFLVLCENNSSCLSCILSDSSAASFYIFMSVDLMYLYIIILYLLNQCFLKLLVIWTTYHLCSHLSTLCLLICFCFSYVISCFVACCFLSCLIICEMLHTAKKYNATECFYLYNFYRYLGIHIIIYFMYNIYSIL